MSTSPSGPAPGRGIRRGLRRSLAVAEAALARRTVRLAPEPPGEREGVVTPDGTTAPAGSGAVRGSSAPLRLAAVGDSLVAGSGVQAQDQALVPRIARLVAAGAGRDVEWVTHARLGATMRRVRYRFLPEVDDADVLFVCAGSNDLMARRSLQEWTDDLAAVLDGAARRGRHVVACSAGQLYRSPALMATLRSVLREWTDAQTEASAAVCAERGVPFVDVAHCGLKDGFWADDGFHPSAAGYEMAAGMIARVVLAGLEDDAPHGSGSGADDLVSAHPAGERAS
ncbi:GDSL-type esterase/lipase family protein [Actinomyces israelii]|uniref:GDSL-type esterase/lipase family protein n=1 Tax=Actinomyces israelii TaxID=1659 RepID=UPI002353C4A6|nr:GDSL-type esterase/lipase family protein [Actinomyces israelii]